MLHGFNLIQEIKDKPSSNNLRKIYVEFKYLQEDYDRLKKSIDIICELINLTGKYLIFEENKKKKEKGISIFDTFAELDFMSEFTKLSSYDNYKINLELINTFSFLMINIKDKASLYYLFSGNCLNKIISKDYKNYDEEYLTYYINFLKSLSLRLDEKTIQLFYIENLNSFALVENALQFYNHEDSMVRSVVRNIILNILKIKNPVIQNYFGKLPAIAYFADITCHLRDVCYKLDEDVNKNNVDNVVNWFDDLVDEILFIDDIFNLNLNKINYIFMNNLFYYFILPIICGSLSSKNDKISKNCAIFLLIFLFCNVKNEVFKNSLFSLIFFDKMLLDIEYFYGRIPEKKNYSYKMNLENGGDKSFFNFLSENYSQQFFVNISKENNIYYLKYNQKYKELNEIIKKTKNISKKIGINKENDKNINNQIEKICMSFISEKDIKEMCKYHKNLCMSSGLNVGKYLIEEKSDYFNICFMSFMKQLFNQAINNDNFYSSQDFKINKIKKGLFSLLDTNKENEMSILLINVLIFVVQAKETNISKDLLKYAGLENMQEKIFVRSTIGFDYSNNNGGIINKNDIFDKKEMYCTVEKVQRCFDNNNFIFNNMFFKYNKIKSKNINDYKLTEKLSSLLLCNKNYMPITFQLICFNINNLCLGWNDNISIKNKEEIINNVKAKYKMVLYLISFIINDNIKNRDQSYTFFHNQWKLYKNMTNNTLFELIKKSIISSCYILISNNNQIENCPEIIKYDKKFSDEENFNNYLLIFMLLHDIKELLMNTQKENNNAIYKDIIKEHFPLDNSQLDFKLEQQYDIDTINQKDIYIEQIEFSFINSDVFLTSEIVIYRGHLYICTKIKKNIIQINYKYDLKNIILLENEENIIECIIIDREKQKPIEIIFKFKNQNTRNEAMNIINNKIEAAKNNDKTKFHKYILRLLKQESTKKLKKFNTDT